MKIEIVFQEDNLDYGVRKNDIYTYIKQGEHIKTYANDILIVDDFDEDYTNEEWLSNLINGLNKEMYIKYEILKIEL